MNQLRLVAILLLLVSVVAAPASGAVTYVDADRLIFATLNQGGTLCCGGIHDRRIRPEVQRLLLDMHELPQTPMDRQDLISVREAIKSRIERCVRNESVDFIPRSH